MIDSLDSPSRSSFSPASDGRQEYEFIAVRQEAITVVLELAIDRTDLDRRRGDAERIYRLGDRRAVRELKATTRMLRLQRAH